MYTWHRRFVNLGFVFVLVLCLVSYSRTQTQAHTKQNTQDQVATVQPKPVVQGQIHTPPQPTITTAEKPKQTKEQHQQNKDRVKAVHQNSGSKDDEGLKDPDVEQESDSIEKNKVFYNQPQDADAGWQNQQGSNVQFKDDPLIDNVIQKQQIEYEQQQEKKQLKSLHSWVSAEMEKISQAEQLKTHQIFAFQLYETAQFKWNPTQFKSGPLRFVVEVFFYNRGDITFADNPDQQDCVEVFAQPQKSNVFTSLGKVYLKKMFTINFFSDYQHISLKNNYDATVLIQISLQATKFVPEKALDDDNLKISAQKIKSILQQLEQTQKKRQKTYRQQWSIRDRQQHHQSQMLILTGVELIIILGTAIVQIYCIKNLFDNRLIV